MKRIWISDWGEEGINWSNRKSKDSVHVVNAYYHILHCQPHFSWPSWHLLSISLHSIFCASTVSFHGLLQSDWLFVLLFWSIAALLMQRLIPLMTQQRQTDWFGSFFTILSQPLAFLEKKKTDCLFCRDLFHFTLKEETINIFSAIHLICW